MTLPNEDVMDLLGDRFVVGFRDIEKDGHVGLSHGYRPDQCAVGTTNGAGGRNVQMVVLDADGTVLHVLPGFWHPQDLIAELLLALDVQKLHADTALTATQKRDLFAALHRVFLRRNLDDSLPRSQWQDFDRQAEFERARSESRDTVVGTSPMQIKPIVLLVHERMQAQPFSQFAAFDMERFVDYGRAFYDNNAGVDKGRDFQRAAKANAERERQRQREHAAAAKAAAKAAKAAAKVTKA
ncbi:MAG: hypothetical protein K8J09_19060 [Planctomycetes bacterium]|nr:hypothetical protein [Planctomycetota bacterium]MCC7398103.1 hypothetical protein [Planctomycetota bacterium]